MRRLTALRRVQGMSGRPQTGQAAQRSDRGAVAVLVAVVLVPVLLGISAIAVDGSMLYAGRRQVQTGADSAALAVAQACAKNSAACTPGTAGDLNALVKENVDLGDADVQSVCIQGPSLADCPAGQSPPRLPDCPIPLPSKANGVVVRTQTQLDLVFARLLKDAKDKANVGACASVTWGVPGKMTAVLPFTVSLCQWEANTGVGASFPGSEMSVSLNDKGDTCKLKNGHNAPGGFGWLDADAQCETSITVGGWVDGTPGQGKGNQCPDKILAAVGTTVYFPIFDTVSGNGNNTQYHIYGLAAVYLTGEDLPAVHGAKRVSAQPTCAAGPVATEKHSFYGCFVKAIVPVGSIDGSGGSPDLGLNVIQMVG